ncbi:hypothetical protein GCM10027051_16260 [Niabella terrae]
MDNFQIGDQVFHKSNSSVVWIVESITETEVYCSTVIKETLEQKKETFAITSIKKCAEPRAIIGSRTRNNHW